jgi:hypothetical protein
MTNSLAVEHPNLVGSWVQDPTVTGLEAILYKSDARSIFSDPLLSHTGLIGNFMASEFIRFFIRLTFE